jgi:hypothetical protein
MLELLRSARCRTREGQGRSWRVAILAAVAVTVSALISIGESHACPKSERSVDGASPTATVSSEARPSTTPARAAPRALFVQTASSTSFSKTPIKIGLLNCCGEPSHHSGSTSCVAGTCSACCAAAQVSDAPLILTDFSRDYVRPMKFYSRTDVTIFLFRPPRSFS